MSNPTKGVITSIPEGSDYHNLPMFFTEGPAVAELKAKANALKNIDKVREKLSPLNLRVGRTVFQDPNLSRDKQALATMRQGKRAYLLSPVAPPTWGTRTHVRARIAKAMLQALPEDLYEKHSQQMAEAVRAGGGVNGCYNRVLTAMSGPRPTNPPTTEEAVEAVKRIGWNLENVIPQKKVLIPLTGPPGTASLRINHRALVGSPFNFTPQNDPDGLAAILPWVRGVADAFEKAWEEDHDHGVYSLYQQMVKSDDAQFVTGQLKVKFDHYRASKVLNDEMRGYCVPPGALKLITSQLIQSAEPYAQNFLRGSKYTTAQRTGLAHNNATRLINALNAQIQRSLAERPGSPAFAYLTSGDDTIIVIYYEGRWYTFDWDYSAYDFSQKKEVRRPIIRELGHQLSPFSPPRAQLWEEMHISHPLVVGQSGVLMFEDGGPSGFPGQSEINDALNNVAAMRVAESVAALKSITKEGVETIVLRVCRELGFTVKIQNWQESPETALINHIRVCPVQFLGYWLTSGLRTEGGKTERCVIPVADPARVFPRLPWQSSGGPPNDASEALALSGLVCSLGVVQHGLGNWLDSYAAPYSIFRERVLSLLHEMHEKGVPFPADECETSLGGLVYVGDIDTKYSSWEALARTVKSSNDIFLQTLLSGGYNMRSYDEEQTGYVSIPAINSAVSVDNPWLEPVYQDDPEERDVHKSVPTELRRKISAIKIRPIAKVSPADSQFGRTPPTTGSAGRPPLPPKQFSASKKVERKYHSRPADDEPESDQEEPEFGGEYESAAEAAQRKADEDAERKEAEEEFAAEMRRREREERDRDNEEGFDFEVDSDPFPDEGDPNYRELVLEWIDRNKVSTRGSLG